MRASATERRPGAACARNCVAVLLAVGMAGGTAHAHADAPALRSSSIQVDGDGFVYVVNPDNDSVSRLTPLSTSGAQAVTWETPVGDYPRTLALAAGSVYTANQNDDTVSRLRASDGAAQGAPKSLGFGCAPYGIAANQDGNRLYAGNVANVTTRISIGALQGAAATTTPKGKKKGVTF